MGRSPRSASVTVCCCGAAVDRVVPCDRAGDVIERRQHAAEPIVDGGFSLGARRRAGGRGESGRN